MKTKKLNQLVKPQELTNTEFLEAYCNSGYSVSESNAIKCQSGYSCGFWSVTSTPESDDVLL